MRFIESCAVRYEIKSKQGKGVTFLNYALEPELPVTKESPFTKFEGNVGAAAQPATVLEAFKHFTYNRCAYAFATLLQGDRCVLAAS